MRLDSFAVQGYGPFVQQVKFGPLEEANALYGPNNAGKSALLDALELYARLLGCGEGVTRAMPQILDPAEGSPLHRALADAFHRSAPAPIRFEVEWRIASEDLEASSLTVDRPFDSVSTVLEVHTLGRSAELRVEKWRHGTRDIAAMDRSREGAAIELGQQVRRLLADACPFQFEHPVHPCGRPGSGHEAFPQALRDRLFDARQSLDPAQRERWKLFQRLARTLVPETGDVEWDTAFERVSGHADLILVSHQGTERVDALGTGTLRAAGLIAELSLAGEPYLLLEEPEWRLSPDLQRRLMRACRDAVAARRGPRQIFVTTHSPEIAGCCRAFELTSQDGAPALTQREWATAGPAGDPPDREDGRLGDLIHRIGTLATIEPEQLAAASTS